MNDKTIYLIGIKGVGMAALAVYLSEAGYNVVGSDTSEKFVTDEVLEKRKIKVFSGFKAENFNDINPELVVVSPAYGQDNPDVKEAKNRHLDIKYYSEALNRFTFGKKMIAVSGVHGKTTTTAMISYILEESGLGPSFLIGAGETDNLKSAKKGSGDYFVVEADEYRKSPSNDQAKFLDYNPFFAVITSIELDHPDVYDSIDDIYGAFFKLACKVPRDGRIIMCLDYPRTRRLKSALADRKFDTYGFSDGADYKISDWKEQGVGQSFAILSKGKNIGELNLKVPGKHNALNAVAAVVTALGLGISFETAKEIIENFEGAQRRFQIISESKNFIIVDDYAHHPTAIKLTLEAASKAFPEHKICCIFQPHTFSRTEKLIDEFSLAFKIADKVIITDIYASQREKAGNISGEILAERIKKNQSGVRFINDWDKIIKFIKSTLKGKNVILTIGAGNIYELALQLKNKLK